MGLRGLRRQGEGWKSIEGEVRAGMEEGKDDGFESFFLRDESSFSFRCGL